MGRDISGGRFLRPGAYFRRGSLGLRAGADHSRVARRLRRGIESHLQSRAWGR